MKIERWNNVREITHDDLVNLFSTALSGSSYLECEYDGKFYENISESKREGDCLEDKIADCLLNEGTVYLIDNYSNGKVYSSLGEIVKNEYGEEYGLYKITLRDIVMGLEKCLNEHCGKWERTCAENFISDSPQFDLTEADAIMQCIMFNETIYG